MFKLTFSASYHITNIPPLPHIPNTVKKKPMLINHTDKSASMTVITNTR